MLRTDCHEYFIGDMQHPDINDPYGSDLKSYRHCATEIVGACDRLLETLQSPTFAHHFAV